jgi:uncharacterized protein (TIGR02391 family)
MSFATFERIVRSAHRFSDRELSEEESALHPFDRRNIHPKLPTKTKKLFDDGHYAEATFEAFKFIDRLIARFSSVTKSGEGLMMAAFGGDSPKIQLTPMKEATEIDEQRGYQFMFAGSVGAIRNPRGHEAGLSDDIDTCLDHLTFASILLRRLEEAGFSVS